MHGAWKCMKNKQQGFALPITLIILSLLTVLAMGLSQLARQDTKKIQNQQYRLNDELSLKSTNQWVLYQLLSGVPDKNTKQNGRFILSVDNRPIKHQQTTLQVQDAAGLMGLYLYDARKFEKLLMQLTDKQQAIKVAAQLKDWIDKDSRASYQGMEIAAYRNTNQAMLPRNGPIRSLDELLELPAMTRELYNGTDKKIGLRDLLLAGGVSDFNIATAPDVLLAAMLNISAKQTAQIQNLKSTKNWRQIRQMTAKMPIFFDSSPLGQAYQYRVILTLPSGVKARSLLQLTPSKEKPYQFKQWQYPDNDRG